MKTKSFYDLHQAQMYLTESIVTYKGLPIYVRDIEQKRNGDFNISYAYLSNALSETNDSLNSGYFNFTPIPLGFVNWDGKRMDEDGKIIKYQYVFDIMRMPVRRYKIGLCRINARMYWLRERDIVPNFNSIVFSNTFVNTILRKYPSYEEVIEKSQKNGNLLAFSPRFAIEDGGAVFYKGSLETPIGDLVRGDIRLIEKMKFLKEVLNKDRAT